MRFTAPLHTSGVSLSTGTFDVDKNGILTVPDDTPSTDLDGLAISGFTPAPEAQAPATKAATKDA